MKVMRQMQSSLTDNSLLQSGPGGHFFVFKSELNREYLPKLRRLSDVERVEVFSQGRV